jgi:replicative DNA helicase
MAEIIIAKHRNGAVGDVLLSFKGQFTRFQDRNADSYVPMPNEEFTSSISTNLSSQAEYPNADPLNFPPPSMGEVPY